MLAEGRDCREVVTRFSAASRALDKAGLRTVAAGLSYCAQRPEQAAAEGYDLADVERLFLKLA